MEHGCYRLCWRALTEHVRNTAPPQNDSHLEVTFVTLKDSVNEYVSTYTDKNFRKKLTSISLLVTLLAFKITITSCSLCWMASPTQRTTWCSFFFHPNWRQHYPQPQHLLQCRQPWPVLWLWILKSEFYILNLEAQVVEEDNVCRVLQRSIQIISDWNILNLTF